MLTLHPQYITDWQGNKISVVLSFEDFRKVIEELEELEDVRIYDEAKQGEQEFIDAEQAFRKIEKQIWKNCHQSLC